MERQAVVALAIGVLAVCACGEQENPAAPVVPAPPDLDLAMVRVPGGAFTMGDGRADCGHDQRTVTLTHPFLIGAVEVTNGEFLAIIQWAFDTGQVAVAGNAVVGRSGIPLLALNRSGCEIAFVEGRFRVVDAGHGASNLIHPVKHVTWFGAVAFCNWLSLLEDLTPAYDPSTWKCNGGDPYGADGYRLPTDAEWERAARFDDGRLYPWGDEDPHCGRANYCDTWTCPGGKYLDGPIIEGERLYDFAGNVYEWCNDWLDCFPGDGPVEDPVGPHTGSLRAIRGAGFDSSTELHRLRGAWRYGRDPGLTSVLQGFRCARTP